VTALTAEERRDRKNRRTRAHYWANREEILRKGRERAAANRVEVRRKQRERYAAATRTGHQCCGVLRNGAAKGERCPRNGSVRDGDS
jgi:hypothetical protein